jgi:hypothetical protein
MNANRILIVGAVVLVVAAAGYYIFGSGDATTFKSTISEAAQPQQLNGK